MAIAVPDLKKATSLYQDVLGAEVSEVQVRCKGGGCDTFRVGVVLKLLSLYLFSLCQSMASIQYSSILEIQK